MNLSIEEMNTIYDKAKALTTGKWSLDKHCEYNELMTHWTTIDLIDEIRTLQKMLNIILYFMDDTETIYCPYFIWGIKERCPWWKPKSEEKIDFESDEEWRERILLVEDTVINCSADIKSCWLKVARLNVEEELKCHQKEVERGNR